MTEGTKSYLIGCHQFLLHPLCVFLAWRLEYKTWPKWWEVVCIFLHDVGICGRQYLSNDNAKIGHWEKGASIVHKLFYQRGNTSRCWDAYFFIAGHTHESGFPANRLARADKRSHLVAPTWWQWWYYWIEGYGKHGAASPPRWRELVAENLKKEKPIDSHQLYIKHRQGANDHIR